MVLKNDCLVVLEGRPVRLYTTVLLWESPPSPSGLEYSPASWRGDAVGYTGRGWAPPQGSSDRFQNFRSQDLVTYDGGSVT